MPMVEGTGTIWNLPNYAGELFLANPLQTPILSMIGGLTGGSVTENFEFPTGVLYDLPDAEQPGISENASLKAPTATNAKRRQLTNVTQIFHESVSISYVKSSNRGRLSGLNTAGAQNNVPDEKSFQVARKLEKMARDIEYTIINGNYQLSTSAAVPNKTRGMLEVCGTEGGTQVDAGAKRLTRTLMQKLFKAMYDNGCRFENVVIFVNSTQKQIITDIYAYAPTDRNVGGVNIKQIETDFGNVGICLDSFMPQNAVLAINMPYVDAVFQPVPGKGNFFYEELSKVGASEDGQIFGQFGLDHGPAFVHGAITNLDITEAEEAIAPAIQEVKVGISPTLQKELKSINGKISTLQDTVDGMTSTAEADFEDTKSTEDNSIVE